MFVLETTPPTRMVSFVTPGWSTAVPPPPPDVVVLPPDLSSDALLHAAATSANTARTAITRARISTPRFPRDEEDLTLTSGNAAHQACPSGLSVNPGAG